MRSLRLKLTAWSVCAAVLAGGAGVLAAPPPSAAEATSDQAAVEANVRAWFAAFPAKDAPTLDRLTAAAFTQDMGDGEKTQRWMALGMPINSPDYFIAEVEILALSVAVEGDSARVTGLIRRKESFSGRVYDTRYDITQAWRREAGGWRIVSDLEKEKK